MFFILVWVSSFISSVGAVNCGLSYFFKFDLVMWITQVTAIKSLDRVMYATIALAGLFSFFALFSHKI